MKVAFLTRSLDPGGAERQLTLLANGLAAQGHEILVITFYSGGALERELCLDKVTLVSLNKTGRWDVIGFLIRLLRTLSSHQPQIVHGYLTISNILALSAYFIQNSVKVVWGVRASNMDLSYYDWTARLTYRLECRLARFADLIISNSKAGWEYATANGFPERNFLVIPNGVDTNRFRYDKDHRARFRQQWGLTDKSIVIGTVARLDPIKGYESFLRAASLILAMRDDVTFVCVGSGEVDYANQLVELAGELALTDRIRWLGSDLDVSQVYSAFDIFTSVSISEGFSNVIVEAMSCELCCAVTDVGDSRLIIGENGVLITSSEPIRIAESWQQAVELKNTLPRSNIRDRIVHNFSIEALTKTTETKLSALLT